MKKAKKLTTPAKKIKAKQIKQARHIMRMAFKEDPELLDGYIANVAMYLHDHVHGLDMEVKNIRESCAAKLLNVIFGK